MGDYKITGDEAEIRIAVDKINNKLDEKCFALDKHDPSGGHLDNIPTLFVTSNGHITSVSVSLGAHEIHLFHTEDDGRIYYEGTDTYESYFKYTQRRWREIKKEVADVVF